MLRQRRLTEHCCCRVCDRVIKPHKATNVRNSMPAHHDLHSLRMPVHHDWQEQARALLVLTSPDGISAGIIPLRHDSGPLPLVMLLLIALRAVDLIHLSARDLGVTEAMVTLICFRPPLFVPAEGRSPRMASAPPSRRASSTGPTISCVAIVWTASVLDCCATQ